MKSIGYVNSPCKQSKWLIDLVRLYDHGVPAVIPNPEVGCLVPISNEIEYVRETLLES